jgi:hypothetical protein
MADVAGRAGVKRERWMSSPWDPPVNEVMVLRGAEHQVTALRVIEPGSGGRFGLEFTTSGNRVLRVMLPSDQIDALARVLAGLASERQWPDDVRQPEAVT